MPLNLVILLGLTVLLTGCVNKIILHPLSDNDIYDGKVKGDVCFSEKYLDEVMQVKIEK